MKKSTYITAFLAGASLTALWVLLKKTPEQTKTSRDQEGEDDFITAAPAPIAPIKELQFPSTLKQKRGPNLRKKQRNGATRPKAKASHEMDNITAIGAAIVNARYGDAIKPRPDITRYQPYYNYLQKEFEVMQLRITNTTDQERTIILWGGNEEPVVSNVTRQDSIDQVVKNSYTKFTTEVGVHPQGVIVNPANELLYVANQLSDTISVVTSNGVITDTISIAPNGFPGHHSPVALAVHPNPNATKYGTTYVVGSVSNRVYVVDLAHTLVKEITVGTRPVAIAFHPITQELYVCNLVANTLSVIDTETEEVITTLPTGLNPRGITIDDATGRIYVMNSGSNSITVYDQDHRLVETLENVSPEANSLLVAATLHPEENKLFVVASNAHHIIPIGLKEHLLEAPISVGNSPYGILYNPENQFLYVGNREDNTISVLEGTGEVLGSIERDQVNIGLAIDPLTNALITTHTTAHTVTGIGFTANKALIIDGDYEEKREEFKYMAAYIKHVKFILSGEERFKILTLLEQHITGQETAKPITFSGYNSAQSFANVSEVFELENTILDGKHRWKFKIAPRQTITILIYYYQLELYKIYEDAQH